MKLFATLTLFCLTNSVFANRIDSLISEKDVVRFISDIALSSSYNPKLYNISLKKTLSQDDIQCESFLFKWPTKNWGKVDFNQDNLTDLFATISLRYKNDTTSFDLSLVIIDNGNSSFATHYFDDIFSSLCHVVKVLYVEKQPAIIFGHFKKKYPVDTLFNLDTFVFNHDTLFSKSPKYDYIKANDTLIYKYGGFIELNKSSINQKIVSLYFETGPCLGECPIFNMTIYNDGRAKYTADSFNNKSGDFETIISRDKMSVILNLINYLNVNNLNNLYSTDVTDMAECKLKIQFSDGTSKEINDYGEIGTFGLKRLYKLFFDLRDNQIWK